MENHIGELQTSLDSLPGRTIKRLHVVDSETTRQADKYLLIECEDGGRFIIPHVERFTRPCPNSLLTLKEAAKEDGAFTVQEALQVAQGIPLGPKPEAPGKASPEDVTIDDARGLTEAEKAIQALLSGMRTASSTGAADKAKDEVTTMIEHLPQERRGQWYDGLGYAYEAATENIKRAKDAD